MQVHPETFKHSSTETYPARKKGGQPVVIERHTVEVTISGKRSAVNCYADSESITVFGIAVRFSHGDKVWPGSAVYWRDSGNVNNVRPNIDKRGNFIVVGFASDYEGKAVRSQHNAVA